MLKKLFGVLVVVSLFLLTACPNPPPKLDEVVVLNLAEGE